MLSSKNHSAVAKMAGVAPSTVSKVFNNYPGVSADTRQTVLAAAAKLGYKPDPALSALIRRRWNRGHRSESVVIGLLWTSGVPSVSGYFKELRDGIFTQAESLGYVLRDYSLDQYKKHSSIDQLLARSGVTALISFSIQDWQKIDIDWNRLYHVFLFGHSQFSHLNQLRYDWLKAVDFAVKLATEYGHRRIGFVSSSIMNSYEERHLHSAYLVNHAELKSLYPAQPRLLIYKFLQEPFAHKDFGTMPNYPWASHPLSCWAREEKPDCIISSDTMPFHILKMAGFTVPQDFSFISLRQGDSPSDSFVTSISHRPYILGQNAVDIVHHLLQAGQKGLLPYPIIRTVEGEIHEGQTLLRKGA